jgi:hypothetical protein
MCIFILNIFLTIYIIFHINYVKVLVPILL